MAKMIYSVFRSYKNGGAGTDILRGKKSSSVPKVGGNLP